MAVTRLQETGAQSTATGPSLRYATRVAAGTFLVGLVLQQSAALPDFPTLSSGETPEIIAQAAHPSGVSVRAFRVRTAVGGTRATWTFPTVAPSAYAISEFSGVRADQLDPYGEMIAQPDSTTGGFGAGTAFALSVNPSLAGEYAQAVIATLGSVSFTQSVPSWTVDRQLQSADISFQSLTRVGGPGSLPVRWTASAPCVAAVIGFTLGG